MITRHELLDIAKLRGMFNVGYAEKDYLLDLILFSISRNVKQELIFKGGTALYKFYKFERFSEDLDFSEIKQVDVANLIKRICIDLSKFGLQSEVSDIREPFNSVLLTFRINGPLYDGRKQTASTIRVDINRKSLVEIQPLRLRLTSLYSEIPPFYVLVMCQKEILAEKIRAIITRNKARDLLDAFMLIREDVDIDEKLIEKKLGYYNLVFDKRRFLEAIDKKQKRWEIELKPLIDELPNFNAVKKAVLSVF